LLKPLGKFKGRDLRVGRLALGIRDALVKLLIWDISLIEAEIVNRYMELKHADVVFLFKVQGDIGSGVGAKLNLLVHKFTSNKYITNGNR
jgi:hypothetical protein